MRLLFVKPSLSWPRSSGHDVHCFHMMRALIGPGHEVSLATVKRAAREAVDGLALAHLPGPGRLSHGRWRQPTGCGRPGCRSASAPTGGSTGPDPGRRRRRAGLSTPTPSSWSGSTCCRTSAGCKGRCGSGTRPTSGPGTTSRRSGPSNPRRGSTSSSRRQGALRAGLRPPAGPGLGRVGGGPTGHALRRRGPRHRRHRPTAWTPSTSDRVGAPETRRAAPSGGGSTSGRTSRPSNGSAAASGPAPARGPRTPCSRFTASSPSSAVRALEKAGGVGWSPTCPTFGRKSPRHQVVVLPFVSGGGIKNKLLEAAAMARPSSAAPGPAAASAPGRGFP